MNDNENINMELDIDSLEEVTGGKSVKKSAVKKTTTVTNTVKAYCKNCGKLVKYLGQDRVNGGNTGKFKCTNKKCKLYNKIKYNDGVKW